jgi:hypothetical protein
VSAANYQVCAEITGNALSPILSVHHSTTFTSRPICFHFEDGDCKFLWNFGRYLPDLPTYNVIKNDNVLCTSKPSRTASSLEGSTGQQYPRKESPFVLHSNETHIHSTIAKSQDFQFKENCVQSRAFKEIKYEIEKELCFEMHHRSREHVYMIFYVQIMPSYATTGNHAKDTRNFTNAQSHIFQNW